MEYLTIGIPVRLWQRVDGCVDNSMSVDVVEGIMKTTMAGACVRDAGWRAAAAAAGELDGFGWPPQDETIAITLRVAHWEWTLSQLERWRPYVTDGAADNAEVHTLIRAALTDRDAGEQTAAARR